MTAWATADPRIFLEHNRFPPLRWLSCITSGMRTGQRGRTDARTRNIGKVALRPSATSSPDRCCRSGLPAIVVVVRQPGRFAPLSHEPLYTLWTIALLDRENTWYSCGVTWSLTATIGWVPVELLAQLDHEVPYHFWYTVVPPCPTT